jgi:hypothetical protein
MKIEYLNNCLSLIDFTEEDSARIGQLKITLREDIVDWSADVRTKTFCNGRTIIDAFEWEGMSTWWMGRLVHKDSFDSNQWLNRLLVMHICNYFCDDHFIDVETDDVVLTKTVLANERMSKVNIVLINQAKSFIVDSFLDLVKLKRFIFAFFREIQDFLLLGFLRDDEFINEREGKNVWFRTLFPVNWLGKDAKTDRLLGNTPLQDACYGYSARYLVYISRSERDKKNGWVNLLGRIRTLRSNSERKVYFPQKTITVKDIIKAYFSSYVEMRHFYRLAKEPSFRKIFSFNDMDLSYILLGEWATVYLGLQQQSKLNGIATAKFFLPLSDGQKIVTYGEFFATNRATYYLTKRVRPATIFIAVQHATNAKNKMFTYFRKREFNFNGSVQGRYFSPYPDYFLVQGIQYEGVLAEFYERARIGVIGSLKTIPAALPNITKFSDNDTLLQSKTLLLAPSVGDEYKIILDFLRDWTYLHDWTVLCSPHPTTDVDVIKSYQKEQCPDLNVQYIRNQSTYDLLATVNCLMASFSSIALEASLFNTSAVRVYGLGSIPQFDMDERIPSFDSKAKFKDWFETQDFSIRHPEKNKSIAADYFYGNDGLASKRFWEFIVNLNENRR